MTYLGARHQTMSFFQFSMYIHTIKLAWFCNITIFTYIQDWVLVETQFLINILKGFQQLATIFSNHIRLLLPIIYKDQVLWEPFPIRYIYLPTYTYSNTSNSYCYDPLAAHAHKYLQIRYFPHSKTESLLSNIDLNINWENIGKL